MKIFQLALALSVLGPSVVLADPSPRAEKQAPAKLDATDLATIAHIHAVDQTEIAVGKLAQKSTTTAGVKAFGAMLVTDHTAADKELLAFAKRHGAVIPADAPPSDADVQAMAKLNTLRNVDFDNQFIQMMIEGHEKELAKLDTTISHTTDPDLRAMLQNLRPTLQTHDNEARQLQNNGPQAAK